MYKNLSPGRIYKFNGINVRAKRQFGCEGCIFDSPFSCLRVKDSRYKKDIIQCTENNIIFIKP